MPKTVDIYQSFPSTRKILYGLYYHEIGHIRFTAMNDTRIRDYKDPNLAMALQQLNNILEDICIERCGLMKQYPYTKDYLLFGNVGDSSGFVMKNGNLHKVTYDHTLVNLLVSAGELTKEEASVHPKKNVLMKALGASSEVDIDIFDCDMDISEILLSSDGLTGMLDREQIEKVLLSDSSVEDKVNKLIHKANNRGGTDNISVAYLVRSESGEYK